MSINRNPRKISVRLRAFSAPSACATLALLAVACADPITSPRASVGELTFAKAPAANCNVAPIKALTVTPSALSIVVGDSATFLACTQYQSSYTVASSNADVAAVPSTVTPVSAAIDQPFIATVIVRVPASAEIGATATITLTDKKGAKATVAITVVAPPPPTPATLPYTGQIVTYIVPLTGRYALGATGGSGGDGHYRDGRTGMEGGIGATARGDFVLTRGSVLSVVVGGQGDSHLSAAGTTNPVGSGGGGGGSFVFLAPITAGSLPVPLIVGGGGSGGGSTFSATFTGRPASIDPSGAGGQGAASQHGGGIGGVGGFGGQGGGANWISPYGGGAGGAGLFGDGTDGYYEAYPSGGLARGGKSYPTFAGGLRPQSYGAAGGFGGGGAGSYDSAGGGGGYSGGGGGFECAGGGGGSFVNTAPAAATGMTFVTGSNSLTLATTRGAGSVTITYVGPQ